MCSLLEMTIMYYPLWYCSTTCENGDVLVLECNTRGKDFVIYDLITLWICCFGGILGANIFLGFTESSFAQLQKQGCGSGQKK